MQMQFSILFLFFLVVGLMLSCAPDQEETDAVELVVSVPAEDSIPRTITLKRDMSPYPPGTDYILGKDLFIANCAVCHHPSKTLTAPPLGNSWAKFEGAREFMYAFVRNGQKMAAEGNERAIALTSWGPNVMLPFPSLSDTMINSILAYAKIEAQNSSK